MISVYIVFVNGGKKMMVYFIMKIVDVSGNVVVDNMKIKMKKIMFVSVVKEMISMMFGMYNSGIGVVVKLYGYLVVGKIGSMQVDYSMGLGMKDQWMIVYILDIVVMIWIGFDMMNSIYYLKSLFEN